MTNKKTILLVFATIVMIVLSIVAVVTSMRLKQLATVPVAPNVPSSKPKAVGGPLPPVNPIACQTTFTVEALACGGVCTTPDQCGNGLTCDEQRTPKVCAYSQCIGKSNPCECAEPGAHCTIKEAHYDDASNKPGAYKVTAENLIGSEDQIKPEQQMVFYIGIENTGTGGVTSATLTDTLAAQLDFVDANSGCTFNETDRKVTCTFGTIAAGGATSEGIRVKVKATATAGTIANSAIFTPASGQGNASTCSVSVKLGVNATPTPTPTPSPTPAPTPTPTPAPGPKCNDSCTSQDQCPSDLKCIDSHCRKEACSGETDCACPLKCNDYCANTAECPSGYSCEANKCRNAQCKDDNDCGCPKPPGCNEVCNPTNPENECVGGYVCDATTKTCRNSVCKAETDCECAVVGTKTPRTPTPTPAELPTAGNALPTVIFIGIGGLLAILGMVLAGL